MTELKIRLSSVDDVKSFVNIAVKYSCGLYIIADRYVVDAKSIVGIFSLDLKQTLSLRIDSGNEDEIKKIKNDIEQFIEE
ncbi:MAG: HPr family phosphocarrier protein [Clostridiales bacterium]|nr:HPr family phosphocarrier protein [Clostridiales bacterium]